MKQQKSGNCERVRKLTRNSQIFESHFSRKMKRKAQMEMMGLAIIVILLALGMFLLVRFMVIEQPPEAKKTFTSKELATNMISTMLKSDSGCDFKNYDIKDLIIAYAEYESFYCNEQELEGYLLKSMSYIFNETLIKWNWDYRMNIKFPQQEPICMPLDDQGNCFDCLERERKIWPLPTDYGTVIITMDICT